MMSYTPIIQALKHLQGKHDQSTHGRGGSGDLRRFATAPVLKELLNGVDKYADDHHGKSNYIAVQLFKELGFDAKPQVVDSLDASIAEGDTELHRGLVARYDEDLAKYVQDFKTGELFVGDGLYGSGTYTANGPGGRATASSYARGWDDDKGIIRMALDKSAKVIEQHVLQHQIESIYSQTEGKANQMVKDAFTLRRAGDTAGSDKLLEQSGYLRADANELYKVMRSDHAVLAAAMGYDAMHIPVGHSGGYMVVLNRGKVKVEL